MILIEMIIAGLITALTYYCNYKFEKIEQGGKDNDK